MGAKEPRDEGLLLSGPEGRRWHPSGDIMEDTDSSARPAEWLEGEAESDDRGEPRSCLRLQGGSVPAFSLWLYRWIEVPWKSLGGRCGSTAGVSLSRMGWGGGTGPALAEFGGSGSLDVHQAMLQGDFLPWGLARGRNQ